MINLGRVHGLEDIMAQPQRDSSTPGSSMKQKRLVSVNGKEKNRIVCGIEIKNWTKFHLTQPQCFVEHGKVSSSPTSVRPREKAVMVIVLERFIVCSTCS